MALLLKEEACFNTSNIAWTSKLTDNTFSKLVFKKIKVKNSFVLVFRT